MNYFVATLYVVTFQITVEEKWQIRSLNLEAFFVEL